MIKKETSLNKIIIIAVLNLIVIFYLIFKIDLKDIGSTFKNIVLPWIGASLLLYLLSNILRAWRFLLLIEKKIGFWRMFSIVSVHNLANLILPARSGEFSYIYLIKKHNINLAKNVWSLVLARILDIVVLAIFLIIFLNYFKLENIFLESGILILQKILLLFTIGFILLIIFRHKITLYLEKINIRAFLWIKLVQFFEKFDKNFSWMFFLQIVVISFFIWFTIILFTFSIYAGIGLKIGLWQIMFIAMVVTLVGGLPIHGPGGFGSLDAIVAATLVSLGFSFEQGTVLALSGHIISIIWPVLVGLFGLWEITFRNEAP